MVRGVSPGCATGTGCVPTPWGHTEHNTATPARHRSDLVLCSLLPDHFGCQLEPRLLFCARVNFTKLAPEEGGRERCPRHQPPRLLGTLTLHWGAALHCPRHPPIMTRGVSPTQIHCPRLEGNLGQARGSTGALPYPPRMSLELRLNWELTLPERRVTVRCAKGAGGGGTSSAQRERLR